jgi:hypothetical protein
MVEPWLEEVAMFPVAVVVARACLRVAHGWKGFMLPSRPWIRMLAYLPARIASREALRLYEWTIGSAMLD